MSKLKRVFATSLAAAASLSILTANNHPQTQNSPPNYKRRADHLRQITASPTYDVVVIGGGCNGAGVALDAATRGMRTLLIEKEDFGSGASSKSTKLIHGGVRYLQQVFQLSLDSLASRREKFQLVKEAISQRSLMIDSAPHLTTKLPFVIPCSNVFKAMYYYVGSVVYYLIYRIYSPATPTAFRMPYFLSREQLINIFPYLNPRFDSGVVYEDGSFNDARLLLAALLTATVGNGIKMPDSFRPANILNRAEFVDFMKDPEGQIVGVVFRDQLTKRQQRVSAKYVVNCTGAWADALRLRDNPQAKKRISLVAGSHITYSNTVGSGSFGICSESPDGRVTLVVPWMNRIIAGTTEQIMAQPTNHPHCSDRQRKFINDVVYDLMSQLPAGDFFSSERARWCGIRPLVADDATSETKKISRNHVIQRSRSGLYSLMGGKWTTYRRMGEDVLDMICEEQAAKGNRYPQSQTKGLPLLGSASASYRDQLMKEHGDIGVQMYHAFGSQAGRAIKNGTLTRVFGSTTVAELEWIVKNELVTDIQDVLMRRTRLSFLVGKAESLSLAGLIGELLQRQLGWSNKQRQQKVRESTDRILSYQFE